MTLCALALGLPAGVRGAALDVTVTGDSGQPLADAVVTVQPAAGQAVRVPPPGTAVLAQRGHRFVPFVLPIRTGTGVTFPNYDDTRHHVYSFSPVHPFEIELYKGDPQRTEVFDRPGVAAIGCNIHDYMQAFVYVTDAPFFARTGDDGRVSFVDLPTGLVQVQVWHPWAQQEMPARTLDLDPDGVAQTAFSVPLTPPPPRRPEENALQQWIQNQ